MVDESRLSLTSTSTWDEKKKKRPLCHYFSVFSALNGNLPRYMPHFFCGLSSCAARWSVLRGNVAFDWALTGLVIRRL